MDPPVIFVVDDDASVREAMRRLLLSVNADVRLFSSAEDFLATTPVGSRGCLVLDLGLPGMSGFQLQEHLNHHEWRLPTVIVTAHEDADSQETAQRLGAIAYVLKPFDRRRFLTAVHTAMADGQS